MLRRLTLVVQVELLAPRLGFVLTHLDLDTLDHVKFEYPNQALGFLATSLQGLRSWTLAEAQCFQAKRPSKQG